ncbi:DegQ family serine endoprotease [Marinobacter orientalis]|uniref:Probable periplasmic serine endoprotease DegP-like n=1 Tax=Marinobacter orientalis TaxID=1928859 RepID=A0A7Y0RDD7_9GAMM|nr:DegQ family serine endoprotease [Marinobacter orientalis]NMT64160.1 DegQ family serine endoprotease [Marinobacter orientalis]TGX49553.1 DegQ family serine endoprotease [Marinobacter orientalis]
MVAAGLYLLCLLLPLSLAQSASAGSLPDFTELVEDNSSAVVNISTTTEPKAGQNRSRGLPFDERQLEQLPDFFRDFFGGPQSPFGGGPGGSAPRQSMGSGFIVSSDGYVLTNNHVVEGADEIIVRLNDRRELPAKLVGTDPRSDMAVLKIENEKDLPVVQVGSSKELKVGEWVLAIGSPFGFDYTVTAGIVSAIGRSLPSENYVPFIQTDVAINPGNSGGPLFNLDGEVVGINSQIYTRSGGFMGVSFAIPIDDAMNVFRQLRDKGTVSRGWLGVLIQEVNRDLAESFGLKRPRGALVAEVMSGSPAEEAGLKAGDIVLEYDGEDIILSSDLPPMVGRTPIGETATLEIMREGKQISLDVEIGKLPEEGQERASAPASGDSGPSSAPLGMTVEPLPDDVRDSLGVSGGVLVSDIAQGPAMDAGIRPRDVITELNRRPINSVEDFRETVASLPEDSAVSVRVVRQGRAIYLVMKP